MRIWSWILTLLLLGPGGKNSAQIVTHLIRSVNYDKSKLWIFENSYQTILRFHLDIFYAYKHEQILSFLRTLKGVLIWRSAIFLCPNTSHFSNLSGWTITWRCHVATYRNVTKLMDCLVLRDTSASATRYSPGWGEEDDCSSTWDLSSSSGNQRLLVMVSS